MITNRDLGVIPHEGAHARPFADPTEASERLARHLTTGPLDRVQRVVLRLLARASISDPDTREGLLAEADELDAALRAARDMIFSSPRTTAELDGSRPAAVPTEAMADVVARAREQQHRAQSLRDLAWETWTQAIIAHARAESVQLSPVVEARLHLLLGKQSGAGGVSRRNADPGVPGRFAAELVDGLVRRPGHDLGSQRAHVQPLTERERTVLHHLAGPLTNAEIAAELHVSVHTVKTHQRSVYRKLGARGRRDAVRIARDLAVRRPGHDLGSQRALVQPLTKRELMALHYLAGPLTNAEIAAELHVSVHTVKTHQRSVYRKLGARGRRDAVRIARDLALL